MDTGSVNRGFDGLIFHRVVAGFVIQGGGYDEKLTYRTPPRTVVNESTNGLRNQKYSVAMARLADPDSAESQFFINVQNNMNLDYQGQSNWGYAVFGKVTNGMEVVDVIRFVKTKSVKPMSDVPVEPVIIKQVTILKR